MYVYLLLIMLCYIRKGNTVLFICCSNPTVGSVHLNVVVLVPEDDDRRKLLMLHLR
jgi:hypothetical protein